MSELPRVSPPRVVVGIAETKISSDQTAVLTTYALGSCVAVMVHAPAQKTAGLIHFMLPWSKGMQHRASENPSLFADTGVPALFHRMYALGCAKGELVIKVAGGGRLLRGPDAFDIGRRNVEMLDYLLARSGLQVAARDVGGTASRTVEMKVGCGEVWVRSRGREHQL